MNPDSTIFAGVRWPRLILGVCITAVLSLSVHAVMIQVLNVPYPAAQLASFVPAWLNDAAMLLAVSWLYVCARKRWPAHSPARSVLVLSLILVCLNETLRGWFMNAYCSTPARTSWLFMAISSLQKAAYYVVAVVMGAAVGQRLKGGWRVAGALVLALFLSLAVTPSLSKASAAVMEQVAQWAPQWAPTGGWCKMPYGMDVLIPAYLTFIEPVLASLFCVALVWRYLVAHGFARVLQFALLILALKKQLLMAFLYAIYAPVPAGTALASMGQFSLEALALGVLMALSWRYAQRATAETR